MFNDIPVIEQYSSGMALGILNLCYDRLNHNAASSNLQAIDTVNAGITPDKGVTRLIQFYKDQVVPIVNQIEASTLGPILDAANASYQSPMGNLLTDSQKRNTSTPVTFTNPGGTRTDIVYATHSHDVTYTDLLTVQPFDNELVTLHLSGAQIYAQQEQQLMVKRILPVPGMKYTYDTALPALSCITSLTLTDNTPDPANVTLYSIACVEPGLICLNLKYKEDPEKINKHIHPNV